MYILSFDCANRSLAVCYTTVNINLYNDLKDVCREKNVKKCIDLINTYVIIHVLKVYDLTKGKKTDTVARSVLLKKCLIEIDTLIKNTETTPDQVLVEYQMSANDKSRCVSQQILYHYSGLPNTNISLVGPTLKNKICFANNNTLEHSTFMEKYVSKYTANKNHSKANFLYWFDLFGLTHLIRENNISRKNIDDIADAFMQIWGWIDYKMV